MHLRPHLLLLSMLLLWAGSASAAVWVALSEGGREYTEAAEAIRTQLSTHDVVIKSWQDMSGGVPAGVTVVVSLGSAAYAGITDAAVNGRWGKVPVVAALLPRASYEQQRRRSVVPGTAVWLDQPATRQFALLKLALGGNNRIGLLLGPESRQWQAGLEKAAQEQGMLLNTYRVDSEQMLYPALQRLLEENEALLAIPDTLVFNGGSVQNILLATYRQRVPMMGFSPAYVRAGAVLALYSTPAQIAAQAARLVRMALQGQTLPSPQAPQEFQISVNASVARSLGMRLSEDALRVELLNREGP